MPPGRQPVIRSKVNKGKAKDDVIAGMDKKRAGGAAIAFKKDLEARGKKASTTIFYISFYAILIAIGASSFTYVGLRKAKVEQPQSALSSPTESLMQDHKDGLLYNDEYATLMSYVLVRYNDLPEKYRQGIPRITREEVFREIDNVWPDLSRDTRLNIARMLPRYTTKLEDNEENW